MALRSYRACNELCTTNAPLIVGSATPSLSLGRPSFPHQNGTSAADLRFTSDEAAAYLNEAAGLDLASEDVAALEERTEGWIAALQLAALSLQGREDVSGFIARFAGDDRYVVDYLVEEVLKHQPDPERGFLLQSAVLDRFTGPLCDAVTGRDDGSDMLVALERANLFIVPLDDRREWYRYHHLFADVLRARMLAEQPDLVPLLHQRASRWYERHDLVASLQAAGALVDELSSTVVLADMWLAAGRPSTARRLYERALQRAEAHGEPVALATADLHVGISEIDREAGDLESANRHLEAAASLGERTSMTESRYRWFVAMVE